MGSVPTRARLGVQHLAQVPPATSSRWLGAGGVCQGAGYAEQTPRHAILWLTVEATFGDTARKRYFKLSDKFRRFHGEGPSRKLGASQRPRRTGGAKQCCGRVPEVTQKALTSMCRRLSQK